MNLKNKLIYSIRKSSREKKFKQFFKELYPTSEDKILDIGISNADKSLENYIIGLYPYPDKITGLGMGDLTNFKKNYPKINAVSYEWYPEKKFPFENNEFDISISNAVIEHVGDKEDQITFLKELARVSKKGLFTTPNKFFPIETHYKIPFLHWMGNKNFSKLKQYLLHEKEIINLFGKKDLINICEETGIPNYKIIPNKFMGLNMTFSVVWDKN